MTFMTKGPAMSRSGSWIRWAFEILLVAVAGCGGEAGEEGSPPVDPDRFVTRDSTRILGDLRALAHDSMEGRRTGEPGSLKAREYILAGFREAGLQEPPGGFVQPFEFRARGDTARVITGANVAVSYTHLTLPTKRIV